MKVPRALMPRWKASCNNVNAFAIACRAGMVQDSVKRSILIVAEKITINGCCIQWSFAALSQLYQ